LSLALFTFLATRYLLKISIFIPAPLLALGAAAAFAYFVLPAGQVQLLTDRFGPIPTDFFRFTPPLWPEWTPQIAFDVIYFALAVVFVSAIESVLCSTMADRLADNRRTLFDPNKELWGQGMVQIVTPLLNGFPCTGALARTATSIKAGAVTPLAGYFKGVLKLLLVYFLASYLDLVPMACIAGILLWVASNMVKPAEIAETWRSGRLHAGLMAYTAAMVPLTDFLTGVLSALGIYACLAPFVGRERGSRASETLERPTASHPHHQRPAVAGKEERP
jgi:MFS superfamily sulfate permease-like transporter